MAEKKVSFEKGMERLEEITGLLDRGEVALDKALTLYEEGCRIADDLQKKLEKAERAVSIAPVGRDSANKPEELSPLKDVDSEPAGKKPDNGEPSLF